MAPKIRPHCFCSRARFAWSDGHGTEQQQRGRYSTYSVSLADYPGIAPTSYAGTVGRLEGTRSRVTV